MGSQTGDLSQFSQEYIDYDQGPAVVGVSIAVGLLALASVGLRLWARHMKRVALGVEDYLIIACVPLLIGTVICAVFAVHLGRVGRHYAVNKIVDPPSYGRSQAALFAVECIYGTLLAVCKFSILAMYWRIFPTTFVKRGCCVLGGLTLAWIIAVALVAFLQCRPIQKIWLPDTPGQCIDNNKFFIGNAVPNIFTDCAIMALPAYEISRLRMGYSQKAGLAGIFLLGIFAIRLIFLFQLSAGGKDGDLTVLIAVPWILTVVEGECAVMCACLPLLRPVAQAVFGRVLTSGAGKSSNRRPSGLSALNSADLITIGGGAAGGGRRPGFKAGSHGTRPFAVLDDTESVDGILVGGHRMSTSVQGSDGKAPSEGSDDIPLERIAVRHDVKVSWTEAKPHG
ncbi:putative integral membrane protein [Diaporthe ampelina]|uniref:Putative integral membrane protein n=1 Tax=Diaporthe ampelina TaxID=1214573 RepID=A0A0G2G0K8_9PEZI|nr:putative integral membrane protein [Diaporthe ampelina]